MIKVKIINSEYKNKILNYKDKKLFRIFID